MSIDVPNCPFCNKQMRKRTSRRGDFWGCSGYPDCRGTRNIVDYSKEIKIVKGSPEQEIIWEWLEKGTENGLIEAKAGSGKTFVIVNAVARLRHLKIGIFSFNNHIIREMNEKLQQEGISWARGCTYNSFGFRAIKSKFQNVELFEDKLPTIISEIVSGQSEEAEAVRVAAMKLTRLCKCYMDDGTNSETLYDLVEKFNIEIGGDDSEEIERRTGRVFDTVPKALEMCLRRKSTLDFDDQIWWTVKMKLPVEQFDMVFVDEAQDTNKMQQELIKLACP